MRDHKNEALAWVKYYKPKNKNIISQSGDICYYCSEGNPKRCRTCCTGSYKYQNFKGRVVLIELPKEETK